MKYIFNVTVDEADERVDIFLSKKLEITRSQAKKMFDEKKVLVNEKTSKAGLVLDVDDVVECEYEVEKPYFAQPENIPLDIVSEDEDLAVINKVQGMVTHPATSNKSGTLVNAILYHFNSLSGVNGQIRPGIVHRLDKDTSGLIIIAKNDKAHFNLAKQIEKKICKRNYLALVSGYFKDETGQFKTGISRNNSDRKKMMACDVSKGKIAITDYKTIEYFSGYSLVEFSLQTGRTHQIRVHCSNAGHPIVGDCVYGGNTKLYANGQLLCAYKIEFFHPTTNELLKFEIKLPAYFEKVLDNLRANSLQN